MLDFFIYRNLLKRNSRITRRHIQLNKQYTNAIPARFRGMCRKYMYETYENLQITQATENWPQARSLENGI